MTKRDAARRKARSRKACLNVEAMETRELLTGGPAAAGIHAQFIQAVAAKTLAQNLGKFALQEVGSNLAGTAIGSVLEAIGIGGGDGAKLDKITSQLNSIDAQLKGISAQIGALATEINQLNAKIDQTTLNQLVSNLPLAQIRNAEFLFQFVLEHPKDPGTPAVRTMLLNYIGTQLLDAPAKFEATFQGLGHSTPLMRAYSNVAKTATWSKNPANGQSTEPFLTSAYSAPMVDAYAYYKDYEALALNLVVEYEHAYGMRTLAKAQVNDFLAQTNLDDANTPKPIPVGTVVDTRTGLMWTNQLFGIGGPPQLNAPSANAFARLLNVHTHDGPAWIATTRNLPTYVPQYVNKHVTDLGIDYLNQLAGSNNGAGDLDWRLPSVAEVHGLIAGRGTQTGFHFLNTRWLQWAVWNDNPEYKTLYNGPWVWTSQTKVGDFYLGAHLAARNLAQQEVVNLDTGATQFRNSATNATVTGLPTATVMLVYAGGNQYFL